jgi:hypothetical protein
MTIRDIGVICDSLCFSQWEPFPVSELPRRDREVGIRLWGIDECRRCDTKSIAEDIAVGEKRS